MDGQIAVARCYFAARPLSRLVGLLGTPDLQPDEGLWLPGCRSVHTFGMRVPIHCAFVDRDGFLLRVVELRPGRAASHRLAAGVLELSTEYRSGVTSGQRLNCSSGV